MNTPYKQSANPPPVKSSEELVLIVIRHIDQLISSPEPASLPAELADDEEMQKLHDKFLALRNHMSKILKGDLSPEITERGYIAGLLKGHLANLRHLTWQVEQVAQGDFTQRVDFMGEFAKAFNHMVVQLDTTLTNLRKAEEALLRSTRSLKREVELRTNAVHALKKSEARFKYLAAHDPLTGALNRRSFFEITEAGLKAAAANNVPCCIALMDIDFFKKVNDTHGHQNGDLTLKHVVDLSGHTLRQSDSLGRYGGEEFIFFFADANIDQGMRAAERVRMSIADNPVKFASGPQSITVSLGVSVVLPEWPDKRTSSFLQKVISMADASLYHAKRHGRNQVCAAPVVHPDCFEDTSD